MKKNLGFLAGEIFLGTLIALLSAATAFASFQGGMSDSKQNEFEIQGMASLNDGNAEYLRSNQDITQDYNYFDNWYLNADERPEIADYYEGNFSEALAAAIERDPDLVWDDQYYTEMYAESDAYFEDSDTAFEVASQWDQRGDQLQLVMLVTALGLAFAAWASLLDKDSNMRIMFAVFGLIAFAAGLYIYFVMVPNVVG
jgi:hypothetical protein